MTDVRPLYDEPFHPVYQTLSMDIRRVIHPRYLRSQKRIRYYLIDLGYAKWFRDPSSQRVATGIQAREKAPEQNLSEPYDPFLVDIYQLGVVLRRDLIPVRQTPTLGVGSTHQALRISSESILSSCCMHLRRR